MAIPVYVAAELLMFVGLLAASLSMVDYTRRRIKELPVEDKKLGRPLYAYAAATLVMGIASLMDYVSASGMVIGPWATRFWPVYFYVGLAILAPALIVVACLIVLGRGVFSLPVFTVIVLLSYVYISPYLQNPIDVKIETADISSIMYIPAVILFVYMLARTKKATALGLLCIVVLYPLYRLTVVEVMVGPVNLSDTVIGLRLLGPAIAAVAFYYHDIGISLELALYGVAYALLSFVVSYMIGSPRADPLEQASLTLVVIAAALGLSTGGYTYTRWKKTRSRPTLALFMFLVTSAISYILSVTRLIGVSTSMLWYYVAIYMSLISIMFLNLSAFFALEWRTIVLLPVAITAPAIIYISTAFPLNPMDLPYTVALLAITGVIQLAIPMFVYLGLWRRMRRASLPASSRPLLLAIGSVVLLLAMMPASGIANPIAAVLILAAFVSWWLSISGRLEGLIKWYRASTAKREAPLGRL